MDNMSDKYTSGIQEYLPAVAELPPAVSIPLIKAHGALMNEHGITAPDAWAVIARYAMDRSLAAMEERSTSVGWDAGFQAASRTIAADERRTGER
jgi:hypothetical protein